jgi:signal transduction histidine kinase
MVQSCLGTQSPRMSKYRRVCGVLGLLLLLISAFSSAAGAIEPKRVMLLHSFGREVRPWSDYAQSIRLQLQRQSPWPLDITDHSLISARTDDQRQETAFADYLRALFTERPLDLIVSIGAPAAGFVQRHRRELFADTPMVFTVVERRRVDYSILTENDAVVPIRIDYVALMANILQVLPETKNVAVIVGTSPIEQFWREEIRKEVMPFADQVAFTFYDDLSFEDILKRAAAPPPHSAISWESMIIDAAGVVHDGDAAFKRLHAVAKAPIFGYYEPNLGEGLVGGPYAAVLDTSRQAAAAAVRILGGEKAGDIRTTPIEFAMPKFDWREMQRWGISESRLPPGSMIDFRDPTAWEQYWWQIMAAVVVILLQAGLIAVLFGEHRRRRKAEVETRRRMAELAHMNRCATAGEMSASIAHELKQPLTAIHSNAEALELMLNSASWDLREIRDIAADIRKDDERASEVLRRLRGLVRKGAFEPQDINLSETVSEVFAFISVLANARGVVLRCVPAPQLLRVRGDRVQLQQVVLNLIVNGIDALADKPPGHRWITGRMKQRDETFAEVAISDSGHGIPSDRLGRLFEPFFTTKEQGMGMGLSIARNIVEAHGGRIWAENRIDGGAIFRLILPLSIAVQPSRSEPLPPQQAT